MSRKQNSFTYSAHLWRNIASVIFGNSGSRNELLYGDRLVMFYRQMTQSFP